MKQRECTVAAILLSSTLLGVSAQAQPAKRPIPVDAPQAVRKEIKNLYSPVPEDRAHAAMALAEMGKKAQAALPFLVSMLNDDTLLHWQYSTGQTAGSTSPGREAAIAVARISPRATEQLLDVLNATDNVLIRCNAIRGLGYVNDSRAVEGLIKLLAEEPGEAALSLGRIGDVRAIQPLIITLKRINRDVASEKSMAWSEQRDLVVGLGRFSDRRAVDVLVEAIKTGGPGATAKAAAVTLGNIGDRRAVEALVGLLGTEVTPEAAQALGKIGDQRAIEPLIKVLDEDWVTDEAFKSLRSITRNNLPDDPAAWRRWLKEEYKKRKKR